MSENISALIAVQDRSYAEAGPGIREAYPRNLAMGADRMVTFLGDKRYAVLATGRRDGRPQAAPVAFSVWRGAFWIATLAGARLRNLRSRPYASIVVIEGDQRAHHWAVIAEGPIVVHDGADIVTSDQEFAEHWRTRHRTLPTWAAAILELRPERIFSFDGTLEGS